MEMNYSVIIERMNMIKRKTKKQIHQLNNEGYSSYFHRELRVMANDNKKWRGYLYEPISRLTKKCIYS